MLKKKTYEKMGRRYELYTEKSINNLTYTKNAQFSSKEKRKLKFHEVALSFIIRLLKIKSSAIYWWQGSGETGPHIQRRQE